MSKYNVSIKPSAQKDLAKVPAEDRQRIREAIEALRSTPRPHSCEKLTNVDAWRIRIGRYRVVYEIFDADVLVVVFKIGPRRDIYR